jgi:hypothetical protein
MKSIKKCLKRVFSGIKVLHPTMAANVLTYFNGKLKISFKGKINLQETSSYLADEGSS